jgi:hypothetical protein
MIQINKQRISIHFKKNPQKEIGNRVTVITRINRLISACIPNLKSPATQASMDSQKILRRSMVKPWKVKANNIAIKS